MEVIAKAKFIHMSPRKVRLVADLVRGMDVAPAKAQLRFFSKAAARPVLKLIESAEANAAHNFKIAPEVLYIKKITVDGGPVLKRFRPRAFGRAGGIKKRSSHITVWLDERSGPAAQKGVAAALVSASGGKKGEAATETKAKKVAPKKKAAVKKTK